MKVALDASLWDEPTTGIGLYTRALAAALTGRGMAVELLGARHSGERPRRTPSRTAYFLAELPVALRASDAAVFHAVANFNLPLLRPPGKALVLTVHDLIPELFPDTVSLPFRWQFKLLLTRALRVAHEVICVSHRTREDLLGRYPVDPARVHVVHNGVDHLQRVDAPDASMQDYLRALALPERFVLYAGALDARKNVGVLLEACDLVRRRGRAVTLVLVGQRWYGASPVERQIAQLRSDGLDLRPLGYQPEPVLYALIRRATVFAFPSRYEGFGLPPLEAMSLGVPTIVGRSGALPEVCGDGALQVEPDDPAGLADRLEELLSSEPERQRWGERGRRQASAYTWARAAEQTAEVYARALARAG